MAEKLREMVLLSKQTTIQVSSAYVGYFLLVAGGYTGTLFISSLVRGCHNPIWQTSKHVYTCFEFMTLILSFMSTFIGGGAGAIVDGL